MSIRKGGASYEGFLAHLKPFFDHPGSLNNCFDDELVQNERKILFITLLLQITQTDIAYDRLAVVFHGLHTADSETFADSTQQDEFDRRLRLSSFLNI